MSDQNVKAAQKYLNAMFGGHKDWVKLDEDGKTGTAVMQGIIRAFQIQNGISTITGTVGPLTINTMKKLAIITKMDPNDTPQVNVCLIQCALFCKGYAAGGITGIYYTSGVNAVKKMQENAGLEVTGKIDWKVWSGLLSLNWFTKVSGGDSNIVLIQQQLNSDWSDVIGVGPCDGIASRQTILSLVGALQAAEGVTTELITDLNSVNFGDATTNAFPGTLQNGCRRSLGDEAEGAVSVHGDDDGDHITHLVLGTLVELLGERHDVDALLTQSRANRGSRSRLAGLDLQLNVASNFLCHSKCTSKNLW